MSTSPLRIYIVSTELTEGSDVSEGSDVTEGSDVAEGTDVTECTDDFLIGLVMT